MVLIGEYAVLEGAPALVTAVDRFARVTIRSANLRHFLLSVPGLGVSSVPLVIDKQGCRIQSQPHIADGLKETLDSIIGAFEFADSTVNQKFKKLHPAEIYLDISDFFRGPRQIKLGLGSSAAMTVALLTGLLQFSDANSPLDSFEMFDNSLKVHRKTQGHLGSGVDIAASVFGGILRYIIYDKDTPGTVAIKRLSMPSDLYTQCIWTGKPASTRSLLQQMYRFKQQSPSEYHGLMMALRQLSGAGCAAFYKKDTEHFLKIIKEYYQLLLKITQKSRVPIISAVHRQIGKIVYGDGGFYKPSGAGYGDVGIAFSSSPQIISKITEDIDGAGFEIIPLKTGIEGVKWTWA